MKNWIQTQGGVSFWYDIVIPAKWCYLLGEVTILDQLVNSNKSYVQFSSEFTVPSSPVYIVIKMQKSFIQYAKKMFVFYKFSDFFIVPRG